MLTIALVLITLLFFSALFSGAETAFTSISPSKAEVVRREKSTLSRLMVFLYDRLDIVIMINLIVSNLVNIMISAYITVLATEAFGAGGKGLSFAVGTGTVLILVFGEILPKKLAILFPVPFAKFSTYLLYALYYVLYPIVYMLSHWMKWFDTIALRNGGEKQNAVSEEEVQAMLHIGKKDGALERKEYEMMQNLLLLNDKEVREVMTRRSEMVAVSDQTTLRKVLEMAKTEGHSRLPVFSEEVASIEGIASIPKLIPLLLDEKNLEKPIADFPLQEPFKVPESLYLDDLFLSFQKKRVHMAIVIDEYGETSGLITLEDVVEEIFGDIEDETDVVEVKIRKNEHGEVICDGDVSVGEIFRFLKKQPPQDGEVLLEKSLSWYLLDDLHRFPKEGETVVFGDLGLSIRVMDMDGERVNKVKVSLRESA